MFIDLSPLKKNREFRFLFSAQTISQLGSMMTYVAVPFQVYELTKSSLWVGLISTIQLIPLLLAGLYGGALADAVDRKKLLVRSEWGLFFCSVFMTLNCFLPNPSLVLLMILAALSSALTGIHRPAMDAILPQIVSKAELTSTSALGSLRYAVGAVAGPAIAGVLIAHVGLASTYGIDALTFLASIFLILKMKAVPLPSSQQKANLNSIGEGLRYAINQPIILGTYLVDIIAMTFAMPIALFPQLADEFQQKKELGLLYAAIPLGAGMVSLFSRPLDRISRQGAGVILSATAWGIFISGMAFSPSLQWMAFFLFLAGAADGISAIYRQTIWNEVIPTNIRGRLGSLNMLSYMVGPLIGNARAGGMASASSTSFSILSGGIICTVLCFASIWIFPKFWRYERSMN